MDSEIVFERKCGSQKANASGLTQAALLASRPPDRQMFEKFGDEFLRSKSSPSEDSSKNIEIKIDTFLLFLAKSAVGDESP